MKNWKVKVKAVWNITQTLIMFFVGLMGLAAAILFDQRQDIRTVALVVGSVSALMGFIPLLTAFVKTKWPK